MSCGCSKRQDSALAGTTLRQSLTFPNSKGLYELATYPGCDEPYHGTFPTAYIYVVGFGTEGEKLYTRGDRNAATRAARTGHDTGRRTTIDTVQATELCHHAVVALLGS